MESSDGIAITVGMTDAAALPSNDPMREARIASVIAAVQNGTYRVDSKAVANALLSRMLETAVDLAKDDSPESS